MGGLAKRMPQTAFFFLVGAVAISALPPLNGFVSEWLTYQSLLQGFGTTDSLRPAHVPDQRRDAGADRRAGGGVFREGVWHHVSGATAQRRTRRTRTKRRSPCCWARAFSRRPACSSDLFPTVFLKLLDPVTQQLTGQQISAQLSAGERPGAVRRRPAQGGTVSTLGIALLGIVPAGRAARAVAGLRRASENPQRPDVGLRTAGSDAADGIHRHGFLQTDPDDFQGAVPSAPRSAARIRFLAVFRHDHPL